MGFSSTEVILQGFNSNLTLLDSRNNNGSQEQIESSSEPSDTNQTDLQNNQSGNDSDDDIPFWLFYEKINITYWFLTFFIHKYWFLNLFIKCKFDIIFLLIFIRK